MDYNNLLHICNSDLVMDVNLSSYDGEEESNHCKWEALDKSFYFYRIDKIYFIHVLQALGIISCAYVRTDFHQKMDEIIFLSFK